MKNKLFISCEEAAHRLDKAQYGEANLWEKITIKIHNVYCKLCQRYADNNKKLTQLFKSANLRSLTAKQKSKMKEKLADTTSNS